MTPANENQISEILNRPYTWMVTREEDGRYSAKVLELPGCVAQGDSRTEALENLNDAAHDWVRGALEDGFSIPEPADQELASGKFLLRLPRSLHAKLQLLAERDGVSLNQHVVSVLSGHAASDQMLAKLISELRTWWPTHGTWQPLTRYDPFRSVCFEYSDRADSLVAEVLEVSSGGALTAWAVRTPQLGQAAPAGDQGEGWTQ